MLNIIIAMFTTGFALGVGPCIAFCAPILLPYVAGTRAGWWEGLKATLIFSFSRAAAYVVLGMIAGLSGELLERLFQYGDLNFYVWILAGSFMSFIGLLMVLGRSFSPRLCTILRKHTIDNSTKSMLFLGFIVGLAPCGPLYAVLTYIAVVARSMLKGMFLSLSFGLGTALSPLIILGVLAGALPSFLLRERRFYDLFSRFCGVLLIIFGLRLIIPNLIYY